jgi:hypothetical protein
MSDLTSQRIRTRSPELPCSLVPTRRSISFWRLPVTMPSGGRLRVLLRVGEHRRGALGVRGFLADLAPLALVGLVELPVRFVAGKLVLVEQRATRLLTLQVLGFPSFGLAARDLGPAAAGAASPAAAPTGGAASVGGAALSSGASGGSSSAGGTSSVGGTALSSGWSGGGRCRSGGGASSSGAGGGAMGAPPAARRPVVPAATNPEAMPPMRLRTCAGFVPQSSAWR